MKYLLIIIFIGILFLIKPLNLNEIEKLVPKTIKIEVKGHLENPGMFEISNYSTIKDLFKVLEFYEDSDSDHLGLSQRLVNNQIVNIRKKTVEKKISINSADVDELIKLKGIGETMAFRIIDFRNENGSFKKLEDLMLVKGIGEKIFLNIVDFITL